MSKKIIIDYSKLSDGEFVTKVSSIITAMTDNPNFPTPVPPLVSISEALGNFTSAMTAADEGGTGLVEIKNQKRLLLAELVRQLGLYIMYLAGGDALVLATTGYDLAKTPAPQTLSNPGVITMKDGISTGMLTASVKRPSGAKSFLYQITPDPMTPQSPWQSVPGSKSKYTFTDLLPGKKYWVRFGAVGTDSQIAYSVPQLSQFVQ
jgi:hypothetical protein